MRLARVLPTTVVACGLAAACAQTDPTDGLDPRDLASLEVPFDKNAILDTASFTDADAFGEVEIQHFLEKTPYDKRSFLATYVSGGIRASAAIAVASRKYALNPLVFLVRAEMDAGLVAATSYPTVPSRVEYAFGCGCPGGGAACDPALGGFDKQVDCYGRAIRDSLGQVCGAQGRTAGGWGVGQTQSTIDGSKVTPSTEATAALYQYTPVVAQGSAGGNWLFFNIWQLYAAQVGYFGVTSGAWVGDACCGDGMCAGVKAGTCAVNAPGGMCTAKCTSNGACPVDPDGGSRTAVCANLGGVGYCLRGCNPGACRTGYKCVQLAPMGGGRAVGACLPD